MSIRQISTSDIENLAVQDPSWADRCARALAVQDAAGIDAWWLVREEIDRRAKLPKRVRAKGRQYVGRVTHETKTKITLAWEDGPFALEATIYKEDIEQIEDAPAPVPE